MCIGDEVWGRSRGIESPQIFLAMALSYDAASFLKVPSHGFQLPVMPDGLNQGSAKSSDPSNDDKMDREGLDPCW